MDYIRFICHCRAVYDTGSHTWKKIKAVVEVRTTNQDRLGGTISGEDAEVIERLALMNMETITAAYRFTGAEATEVEMEDKMEATSGTWVCGGCQEYPTYSAHTQYIQCQKCINQAHHDRGRLG